MATISEAALALGKGCDEVEAWASEYAEHLSDPANAASGGVRQFDLDDLGVLALVEEFAGGTASGPASGPDEVRGLLRSGVHRERFLEWARLNSTLFADVPEDADENWRHGVMVGGMAQRDLPAVARSYKLAADELLKTALGGYEPHELDYPVLFLYRHSVELYLKAMLVGPPPRTHDLESLTKLLESQANSPVAGWVRGRLRDFQQIDARSDFFRYAGGQSEGEVWVDFRHLRVVMDRLAEAFESHLRD